jgi:hypothetical protein
MVLMLCCTLFGVDGGLEHFLEDFALVNECALLPLAVIREVGTKASKEAGIKVVHEGLTDTDRKHLLVYEWTRGSEDLCVIIKNQGEKRMSSFVFWM